MTQPAREGWVHRGPRPLLLWCGFAAALVGLTGLGIFLWRIGGAIADAYERSAHTMHPVPDMTGGLPALLTAIGGFLAIVLPQVLNALTARNRERRDQIAQGVAPAPFVPPASLQMPSGDSSPAEGGPRPGDTP